MMQLKDILASQRLSRQGNLEKLSNNSGRIVRYYVARNPNTSQSVLEKLSNDSTSLVRDAVVQNIKNTRNKNKKVITVLSIDSNTVLQ